MNENNSLLKYLNHSNLKVLGLSFISLVILSSISFFGLKTHPIVSPLPKVEDIYLNIPPKLEQRPNTFQLKKSPSIIPTTYANSNYSEASSFITVDFNTGEILSSKNSTDQYPIASITKVMTAVVTLDLNNPDDIFTVSENASQIIPTKIGVVPNQKMTVQELLEASLMTSANDAIQVLKEGTDQKYKGQVFIKAMNDKAKFLGLKNTNFSNPQGFDSSKNYSSSQDLAILAHYALTNYPLIADIVQRDYAHLPENLNHKQFDLYNWNGLIGVYPGITGVKIGNTDDAGKTTLVVSERQGKKIIAVLLNAPGILERDLWTAQLLDDTFEANYKLPPVKITEADLHAKYQTWKY